MEGVSMTSLRRRLVVSTTIILWGTLLGLTGLSFGETPTGDQVMVIAVEAYRDGDYPRAESQIVDFLERFPQSPHRSDMRYLLGRAYFLQNDFRKARETLLLLINDNHVNLVNQSSGLFWLAESCAQLDLWDEATTYYRELVNQNSGSPFVEKSLFALGVIALHNRSLTEAEDYFSKGVAAFPTGRYKSQSQYYRGLIYSEWNNYHRAVQLLREAIFSPPSLAGPMRKDALFYLAENRVRLGQFQLALPYYRDFYTTYAEDSRTPAALYGAAWCELNMGQKRAALRSFQELIRQFPKSAPYPFALNRIGEIHLEQGDYEKAREAFGQVVKEFPDSELVVSALVNLGWCHLNVGDFDEMTEVAHRLLEQSTRQEEKTLSHVLLGEAHFHRGHYKEALPYFFNLLNTPSQRENALYKISRSYFNEKKYKDAITNIEILLLEYPDAEHLEECLYLRGQAAHHLGETEKAIASYSEILTQEGRDSWTLGALYELGKMYYERKDVKKARDLFSRIVRIAPDGPTTTLASYFLGILYSKDEGNPDALLHLHNALKSSDRAIKAECHYRMGVIYLQRKAYDLSIHHFRTIVDTLTDQRGWVELALFQIGNVRVAQGDTAEAKRTFQKVLEVSKDPDLRASSDKMLSSIGD
jgi:TolA-binding protein